MKLKVHLSTMLNLNLNVHLTAENLILNLKHDSFKQHISPIASEPTNDRLQVTFASHIIRISYIARAEAPKAWRGHKS